MPTASFSLIRCSIKFQLCVGHFPDGRMRTRTFGIKNVRPDVTADDAAAVARAVAPLLAYPVVRVTLVRKFEVKGLTGGAFTRGAGAQGDGERFFLLGFPDKKNFFAAQLFRFLQSFTFFCHFVLRCRHAHAQGFQHSFLFREGFFM